MAPLTDEQVAVLVTWLRHADAAGTRMPAFNARDRVQVDPAAPHYAGRTGAVEEAAFCDDMFGYWLRLDYPDEPAWVPAEALTALDGGERQ